MCNHKYGLSIGFSSGAHLQAHTNLHASRRAWAKSQRIKRPVNFTRRYNLYFIAIYCGAPDRIRTDDPILTMDVLYQLSYGSINFGGARRDRTDDLLNANQALFQLSYGPKGFHFRLVVAKCYRMGLSSSSLMRSRLLSFARTNLQTRISTVPSANIIF